jgi:hypothetical protein
MYTHTDNKFTHEKLDHVQLECYPCVAAINSVIFTLTNV